MKRQTKKQLPPVQRQRKTRLAQLERAQDEATLAFWEAMRVRTDAQAKYGLAEAQMVIAKQAYLRAKLGIASVECSTFWRNYAK